MIRAALRNLTSHKLRLALTVLAIVLGVSFVAGTFVFTDSLKRSFDTLFAQQSADVVVQPRPANAGTGGGGGGGGGGDIVLSLPESTVAAVAAVPGVAEAEGFVASRGAVVLGPDGKPLSGQNPNANGRSWLTDPSLGQITIVAGRPPATDGEVVLDSGTAERAEVQVGGTVRLAPPNPVDGSGVVERTVVGLVDTSLAATAGGTLVAFTLPDAQRLLLAPDRLSQVRVRAAPGVGQAELAARIDAALPATVETRTGEQLADDTSRRLEESLGFLNTFLLVFALIALFVATFLIYNTFTMLVAQRTRELALLRAIGASRGQVQGSVLVEALVVGVVASTIGLVVGLGLAQLLRGLFKAFGIDLPAGELVVAPRTVAATYAIGIVVTLVCAWFPARRAGRVAPVAAMRDDANPPPRSLRRRALVAAVLILIAAVLAAVGLRQPDGGERAAQLVGLSALAAVIGAIAAAPFLARPLVQVLGSPFRGAVGRLARENGRRNPRRTAATSTALTVGVALMSVLAVIAASATASISKVIDETIGADYIVLGAGFRPFSPEVFRDVEDTPGIGVATFVRTTVSRDADGTSTPVAGVEPDELDQVINLDFLQGSLASLGLGSALVDSEVAAAEGYRVGEDVTLRLPNGVTTVRLAGIYEPAAFYQGFIVSMPTLTSLGSLERDTAIYLKLAPDADPDTVRGELDRRLAGFPTVTLQDQVEFKDSIRGQVNQLLGFIFALLALAVLIAVLGIVNTLLLSVVERTRELGLLRAVGATRAQVRRMITLEAVLLGLFGAVVGVVVGVVYGVLLQRVLEPQGITELDIPGVQLAAFVLLGAVGGVLAALWPAWRASRLDVLRAIASE